MVRSGEAQALCPNQRLLPRQAHATRRNYLHGDKGRRKFHLVQPSAGRRPFIVWGKCFVLFGVWRVILPKPLL